MCKPWIREATQSVLEAILFERRRQHIKWGEQNHPDGTGLFISDHISLDLARHNYQQNVKDGVLTWRDILAEEYFEVLCEDNKSNLEDELIQLAAVATAWVEKLRRERANNPAF